MDLAEDAPPAPLDALEAFVAAHIPGDALQGRPRQERADIVHHSKCLDWRVGHGGVRNMPINPPIEVPIQSTRVSAERSDQRAVMSAMYWA